MSDKDIGDFLLRACHDLRSSLRAIQTHAELLNGSGPVAEADRGNLRFIVDGSRRIDSLADGLSGYSLALQIEQASFRITRMDVALRTALARLDKELRSNGAEVTCGELPRVSGDPDRLAQIFEIMLRNSLRHRAGHSPRIHIEAEKQVAEWRFSVRDNGPGIDDACLESIFKPFERLRGHEREGAGLGLTICRIIVERHGGRVWAESAREGSKFVFTLPELSL